MASTGEVVFENVRSGTRPDRIIRRGVWFRVPPRGSVAIVGPTGASQAEIEQAAKRAQAAGSTYAPMWGL